MANGLLSTWREADVDIRIDTKSEGSVKIVRLAGRLAGEGVGELRRECREAEGGLVLDVAHLVSADAEGTAALRELIRKGAEIRHPSPFFRLLLDDEGI